MLILNILKNDTRLDDILILILSGGPFLYIFIGVGCALLCCVSYNVITTLVQTIQKASTTLVEL